MCEVVGHADSVWLSGLPLKGVMDGPLGGKLRGVGQEEDEDQDGGEEDSFNDPFCTLVKNCNMLQNIVGPACVFLRQGFSKKPVCSRTQDAFTVWCSHNPLPHPPPLPRCHCFHSCRFISIPASWPRVLRRSSCVRHPVAGPGQTIESAPHNRSPNPMECIDRLEGYLRNVNEAREDVEVKAAFNWAPEKASGRFMVTARQPDWSKE